MTPNQAVFGTVDDVVYLAVFRAAIEVMPWTVYQAVYWAVCRAGYEAVCWAVDEAMDLAVNYDPPHPDLLDFLVAADREGP